MRGVFFPPSYFYTVLLQASASNFDKISNIWLEPFSVILNCMFPVEYIYGNWFKQVLENKAKRSIDPELLCAQSPDELETGSRVEGFCIPEILVANTDEDPLSVPLSKREHWQADVDNMLECQSYTENVAEIFTVEHIEDDPRYVRLRLTNEWKYNLPQYKDATFLNQTFNIPYESGKHTIFGYLDHRTSEVHGPVRKLQSKGFVALEENRTRVFKYPQAWPDSAMEWLVRPRHGSWPSPELIQDIFEAGCHIAPVGRGKRHQEPIAMLSYVKDPSQASTSKEHLDLSSMDETEWRLSSSVAENKLGQSVIPVQRHVIVLLKILKKMYFPDVISSYLLKNLLFWEIEKQDESFWKEDNSAKCVVYMLDRLAQCLEDGCLPHYIIPESNLLQNEDPRKLAEGAATIRDVRKNILAKTIGMLKRITSLTYLTPHYLQDLDWDLLCIKIDDVTSVEEAKQLTCSLLQLFSSKCKDVIEKLFKSIETEDLQDHIKMFLNVPLYAYESLLARCLCRLFVHDARNGDITKSSNNDFVLFVKEQNGRLSSDDEFIELSLLFFAQAKVGKELSDVVPCTIVMEKTKEIYTMFAQKHVEKAQAEVEEEFWWLRSSELDKITRKVFDEISEGGKRLENLTNERIYDEVTKELELLKIAKENARKEKDQNTDE